MAALEPEEFEELLPGDSVQDNDGDIWEQGSDGRWNCMSQRTLPRLSGDVLLDKYGPLYSWIAS